MDIKTDLHLHTLYNSHAYSTAGEYISRATNMGLELIAITDHGPEIMDSDGSKWHFTETSSLPRKIDGLTVLWGVEANIISHHGELDIDDRILQNDMDWVIASYHTLSADPDSAKKHTHSYLKLIENNNIDVLGHTGSSSFMFDYKKVIKKAAEYNKIIEINEKTFSTRKRSVENCIEIAKLCKKYGVNISVNSDSHIAYTLGLYPNSIKMLEEIGFPEKQIINLNAERVIKYIQDRKDRRKLDI